MQILWVTMSLTSLGPNFLKHSMKIESQNQIVLAQLPDSPVARHELNTSGLGTWLSPEGPRL